MTPLPDLSTFLIDTLSFQIFVGPNFRWPKIFVGPNFRHILKISSIRADKVWTDKVRVKYDVDSITHFSFEISEKVFPPTFPPIFWTIAIVSMMVLEFALTWSTGILEIVLLYWFSLTSHHMLQLTKDMALVHIAILSYQGCCCEL